MAPDGTEPMLKAGRVPSCEEPKVKGGKVPGCVEAKLKAGIEADWEPEAGS